MGLVDEVGDVVGVGGENPKLVMEGKKQELEGSKETAREKWSAMVERHEKRKEAKRERERQEQKEKEKQLDAWIEKERHRQSMKVRIDRKMRKGNGLDMAEVEGLLDGMPVGFYIAPPRPVAVRDPAW